MRQAYVCSLRSIALSPAILNLNCIRTEYFPDVTITERTARSWATSLTLADGTTSLQCDAVTGSSDLQRFLLVPRQHYDHAQAALRAYCLRLNVLVGERKTTFRDSLPGLPSEMHFDASTQDNMNFIEQLSSNEVCLQAPAGPVKDLPTAPPVPPPPDIHNELPDDDMSDSTPLWPPPASISQLSDRSIHDPVPPLRFQRGDKPRQNPQSDDRTASTTRSDSASIAAILSRLQQFDKILQFQQNELQQVATTASSNYKHLETRLERLGNLDETIIHRMEEHQAATMTAMTTQFEGMMAHMASSFSPSPIAPYPSSKRSHASTREASIPESPHASLIPGTSAATSTMSVTSNTSSNSSHARSPRQKKITSIRTNMAHLDLTGEADSADSSVLSDLGDLYSAPPITAEDLTT